MRSREKACRKQAEPDPQRTCREQASKIVRALPRIVDSLLEKAEAGSYLHAGFLFEFAGIQPAAPEGGSEPSLAALLLERLELEAAPPAESPPAPARR